MLKWMKSNWKAVVLFILIFIVAIPLAINWAFKQYWGISWLEAEWSVDTALTFYGSIVAACIAVYGVFLTIQYSQNNYKEDVRNRTLPFIVIDMLKTKSKYNLFSTNNEDKNDEFEGYAEYKLQDYYCILENGRINYKAGLTKSQRQLLEQGGTRMIRNGSEYSCVVVDDICVPVEIENVGNGTAVSLRYGLNRSIVPDKDKKYLPSISLKPNQPIMFHIFSEDCGKGSDNLGEYELAFHYEDIYANQYMQLFNVEVYFDDENNCPGVTIDMDNEQKFIGGKLNGKNENGIC